MREIKFRAWDDKRKLMYLAVGICCDGTPFDHEEKVLYDTIPMQFTGLRDRSGKEIFEGDIISYKIEMAGYTDKHKEVVIFKEGRFKPVIHPHYEPQIIGNIYENPELLKEKL
jgi:uncharacterized phage protein (TIGR01671 family)